MFTGIIEATGMVEEVLKNGTNKTFRITSSLASQLRVDQSVSHDGVCLTVEKTGNGTHTVTAVEETLLKTTLKNWKVGKLINLERCLELPARLDGHLVQGHVDATAICTQKEFREGSWNYTFRIPEKFAPLIVEKGSISLNGISLTIFDITLDSFRVTVIPYTYEHTNIQAVEEDSEVNIEFDILGKYVLRNQQLLKSS